MKTLYNIYILAFLVVIVSFTNCQKSEKPVDDLGVPLEFQIAPNAIISNTVNGVEINSIRIMAVNSNGQITYNKSTIDGSLVDNSSDNSVGSYLATLKAGAYTIYVIANETATMSPLLSNAHLNTDLPAIEVEDGLLEKDLVLTSITNISVRENAAQPGMGEVSTNGGTIWSQSLSAVLKRVAVKVTLNIAKDSPIHNDVMVIKKVEILQCPPYSFLIPKIYSGVFQPSKVVYDDPIGITYDASTPITEYKPICSALIPEHLLTTQLKENTSSLLITALYNGVVVTYPIPICENPTGTNFDLNRNKHFVLNAKITKKGDFNYSPETQCSVLDWVDSGNSDFDFNNNYVFAGNWIERITTPITGNVINVNFGDYVEYSFSLLGPAGSNWQATLDNGGNFAFDTSGGAVTSGIAAVGVYHTIRIKPTSGSAPAGTKTEFYITVSNGTSDLTRYELDLNNSGNTGSGNRFVINQIP